MVTVMSECPGAIELLDLVMKEEANLWSIGIGSFGERPWSNSAVAGYPSCSRNVCD